MLDGGAIPHFTPNPMIQANIDGTKIAITKELVEKYNHPGPRYTSYPTAPNWNKDFGPKNYRERLETSNKTGRNLSLYFHIPFCEERCTFCACSVVATKRHEVAEPYLDCLLKEIKTVSEHLNHNRPVSQIHWGGGTPTYLTPAQIEKLFNAISQNFSIDKDAEISIEVDPRVTTDEQLKVLRRLGFNRSSLGVQDFEPEVQELAGRIQSEEETRHTLETCKELGFKSVNIDLVYGLPKQTFKTFENTLQKVLQINPDRIALFNFAFVPWMHAHQRKLLEQNLPNGWEKLQMFCNAVETFQNAGYEFIGLDHFAKKEDELSRAKRDGTMYRNFQGYTTKADCDLIGLGVTSIGYVDEAFTQNQKKLKDYEEASAKEGLATNHGMFLTEEDLARQRIIREIFCHQKIERTKNFDTLFSNELKQLAALEADGLVKINPNRIDITPLGRLFLRNIGMIFDAYLKPGQGKFSKTV